MYNNIPRAITIILYVWFFSGGGHSTYDLRPPLQPHHKYSGGGGPATSAVSNRLSLSHNLSRVPPSNGSGAASSQRKHPAAKENRSKSIRWTKDQLKKMDKLGHTGSCSSSSNGNVHDPVSIPVLLICDKRKYISTRCLILISNFPNYDEIALLFRRLGNPLKQP